MGIVHVLIAVVLAVSYTNVLPEIYWPQAVISRFSVYFALLHLVSSIILPLARKKFSPRFYRFALPLTIALLIYYGAAITVSLGLLGSGDESVPAGVPELTVMVADGVGDWELTPLLEGAKPQLAVLLHSSRQCPPVFPFEITIEVEAGLLLCSQYPVKLHEPEAFEVDLPPSLLGAVDIPGVGEVSLALLALLPPLNQESFVADDVVVRRLASHLRHAPIALAAGDFRTTIFGKFYRRLIRGAELRHAWTDWGGVVRQLLTPSTMHVLSKGPIRSEELSVRSAAGGGRVMVVRLQVWGAGVLPS